MASLGHQLFHICQQVTVVFLMLRGNLSGNRWEHSLRQCHYFACKPWMSAHYNVRHPSIFGVQLFQTYTNYLITHWAWPRLWWWGINLREIHLFQQSLQVWWSFLHYICNACRLLQPWLYKVCNVYKEHVIFVIWKTSVWLTGQCSTHYVCISLHSINAIDRTRQINFVWRYA